ncbi:MAG: metallophosphoesterase [Oscillospiraceae bacterium]|nr:metallophosphoesterase [Oscillospiraceae bacterium]
MSERIRKDWFSWLTFFLTLLTSLFWVALRVNYSGISKFLGADTNPSFLVMNLPVMVCVLAWLGFALATLAMVWQKHKKGLTVAGFVIGVITAAAAVVVVLFGAKDYLNFIMVHMWESMAFTACLMAFAGALFFPVANTKKSLPWKAVVMGLAIILAVVVGYQLRPCSFTYGAVVYAVEDDYQIVFSTSDSAAAWVEIGGERYYDLYAGSMRSNDRVHKVTVPQSVLDGAGEYRTCAQQMIYRGPFGGYKGKTISRDYTFRPVDMSGGLTYVAISDVHEAADAAIRAASYEDQTDFVIFLGDIVSMVESEKDAQLVNKIAYGITGGQIPVIYARGNHEIKGEYAEDFYRYVGSRNQEFYYWVTLGDSVFAVVLDLGEDHEDDWWEYYGTAQFDLYRQAQTEFLEELLEAGDYARYPYRMALCHIPIPYVEEGGLFESFRLEWTELLNQMNMDVSLSGHLHEMWQLLHGAVEPGSHLVYAFDFVGDSGKCPGGYLADFRFPTFLVGRRSLDLTGGTQKDGHDQYVCFVTQADLNAGQQTGYYVNSTGHIPVGYYPFEGSYSDRSFHYITTELNDN